MHHHITRPHYTLASLIPTTGSRQARNAAKYSPIFDSSRLTRLVFHGGLGVGKDHLLQGIAHHLESHDIDFGCCNAQLLLTSILRWLAAGTSPARSKERSARLVLHSHSPLRESGDWANRKKDASQ